MKLQVNTARWMLLGLAWVSTVAVAWDYDVRLARIIDEGKLGERGIAADGKLNPPGTPASLLATRDDVCVTMGYNIKPNGHTSNIMVLSSWSTAGNQVALNPAYADEVMSVAADTVSQWKFRNADGDGPISGYFTATTFSFNGSGHADGAALRDKCRINDLTAHVQTVKATRFRSGSRDTYAIDSAVRAESLKFTLMERPGPGTRTGIQAGFE